MRTTTQIIKDMERCRENLCLSFETCQGLERDSKKLYTETAKNTIEGSLHFDTAAPKIRVINLRNEMGKGLFMCTQPSKS